MALRYFFNHNVSGAVARGLRQRGVDVVTARDDDSHELEDPDLLQRSVVLDRVLFTHDDDLLRVTHQWQTDGRRFPGVVYVHQTQLTIGHQVRELEWLANAMDTRQIEGRVLYLPVRGATA